MFTVTQSNFRAEVDDVKAILQWNDELMEAIATRSTLLSPELVAKAPKRLSSQVFDHCATVGRIYALFEKTISDLVEEYLRLVPRIYPEYGKLPDRLRNQHRVGVGQVLLKWSSQSAILGHLAEKDIANGLVDGLRGSTYEILSDAFLTDRDNYRVAVLDKIFGYLGFDKSFAWVRQHPSVVKFTETYLSDSDTPDSFLDAFVKLRNEAAHTTPTNIVGAKSLMMHADYLVCIVDALGSLLRSTLIKSGCANGCSLPIGEVLHVWSHNIVGVKALQTASLAKGDHIYAGKRCLERTEVISLRIGAAPQENVKLLSGSEFGLKADRPLQVGARLFLWLATP